MINKHLNAAKEALNLEIPWVRPFYGTLDFELILYFQKKIIVILCMCRVFSKLVTKSAMDQYLLFHADFQRNWNCKDMEDGHVISWRLSVVGFHLYTCNCMCAARKWCNGEQEPSYFYGNKFASIWKVVI